MAVNVFIMAFLIGSPLCVDAQTAEQLLGKWKDSKHPEKQVIMLRQSAAMFYGRTLPQDGEAKKEETILFKSLIWEEKSRSYSGVLIDPATGKEFPVLVKLKNRSTFTFEVKVLLFRRQFEFSRID